MTGMLCGPIKFLADHWCNPTNVKIPCHTAEPKPLVPKRTGKGDPSPKALKVLYLLGHSRSKLFKNFVGEYKLFTPWADLKIDKRTILSLVTTSSVDRGLRITPAGRDYLKKYDVTPESSATTP